MSLPPVTVAVLTYGDHEPLVRRCLDSIGAHVDPRLRRLVVGANAPGAATRALLQAREEVDVLHCSDVNLNKCPMMRRMLRDVDTDFVWWFDDDSYVEAPGTLERWLEAARRAPPETAMWGHVHYSTAMDFSLGSDVESFVRSASWFRGLPPPSWAPGGKGELDFEGRGTGDGRWFFALGGCWLARTRALRAIDWPDPALVKRADDIFLGEALRQQRWGVEDVGPLGVRIGDAERRGGGEDEETMRRQMRRGIP